MDPAEEAAMGFSEFDRMKRQLTISTDPSKNEQVQRVGKRLSQVMPVPNAKWEFVVFDDPSPNAFALPGGKVGVHTGLFQVTQNDAGMAAVIGHEVAHVVARHSGERLSRGMLSSAVVAGAGIALGSEEALTTAAIAGGAVLERQSFSRKQELEADRMGAIFMARAGYDPAESVALWKRFAAWRSGSGTTQGPVFLSSHPLDQRRISELQQFLPQAQAEYQANGN
ncbi:MAG: M48 family metallopeptidase [Verrucomicrobiota bacterium]